GHEAVKDDLLEDIALARRIKELGYRGGLLASGGVSRCRMYESWAEFKRGWKRIYTESANRRSDRLTTAGWRLLLTAGAMPLVAAAAMGMGLFVGGPIAGIGFVVGAVALAIMIVAMSVLHRGIEAPLGGVVAAPLGAFAVSGILLAAARDLRKGEPTQWAGRSYVREDRAKRRGRPTSESAA
ncbi:MAG: hypothetical protein CMJ31_11740, partial [Phycisphaerae bacterium]|nr:hypothetical protein [Phycisphaerae bacterium]